MTSLHHLKTFAEARDFLRRQSSNTSLIACAGGFIVRFSPSGKR